MHSIRPKFVTAIVGISLLSGAGGVVGSGLLSAAATTLSTVRINAGGPAVVDGDGNHWVADTDYVGGKTSTTTATIANTRKTAAFRDMRFDVSAYHIPVVNGTYDVNLLEAEIYFNAAGKRVFNVSAEGKSVAKNVDVFKLAGGKDRAYWIKFTATVTDGSLDLGFTKSVNYPQVSGISVLPAGTAPTPTPTPTPPPSPSPTPSPTP